MMTLTRWDPMRDLMGISDRLNRLVVDSTRRADDEGYGAWVPPVDIFERGENLVIRAEMAGVDKDNIDVRVENGVLTLHGQRKRETEIDEAQAYRLERIYGTFTRSFTLPTSVDASRIEAAYRDGVLEVVLPKAEEAKSRRIQILA